MKNLSLLFVILSIGFATHGAEHPSCKSLFIFPSQEQLQSGAESLFRFRQSLLTKDLKVKSNLLLLEFDQKFEEFAAYAGGYKIAVDLYTAAVRRLTSQIKDQKIKKKQTEFKDQQNEKELLEKFQFNQFKKINLGPGQVRRGVIAPDGSKFYVVSNSEIVVLDLQTLQSQVFKKDILTEYLESVVISADGGHIFAAGGKKGQIVGIDLKTMTLTSLPPLEFEDPNIQDHQKIIRSLAITPDSSKLIACANGGEVKVIDLKNGFKQVSFPFKQVSGSAPQLNLSPDGSKLFLFANSYEKEPLIIDMYTLEKIPVIVSQADSYIAFTRAVFSPDGRYLFVSAQEQVPYKNSYKVSKLYELGTEIRELKSFPIAELMSGFGVFSGDSSVLAYTDGLSHISLLDTKNLVPIDFTHSTETSLMPSRYLVEDGMALNRDGSKIATFTRTENSVKIFDTIIGIEVPLSAKFNQFSDQLFFMPDDSKLVVSTQNEIGIFYIEPH